VGRESGRRKDRGGSKGPSSRWVNQAALPPGLVVLGLLFDKRCTDSRADTNNGKSEAKPNMKRE